MLKWAFALTLLVISLGVAAVTGDYIGLWNVTDPVLDWLLGVPAVSRHVEIYRAGRGDWEEWQQRRAALESWEDDLRREAQRLEAERLRLQERARALEREAEAHRREAERLQQQRDELQALQEQQDRLEQLQQIFSAMRPEEAARVVERLDDETVIQLLAGMEARQAGRVLGQIDPARAAEISRRMGDVEGR